MPCGDSSVGRGAALTQVRVPGVATEFSPTVNFQCRLSYSVRTAPVCSDMEPTSVGTLKIPSTGSYTTVWTQGKTGHTGRYG